jgi:predicted AlkP superfamily pyrophosphatase or phosphodiesterase
MMRSRGAFLTFLFCMAGVAIALPPADDAPKKSTRPKLAVLLVFDQFRGDYLERWKDLYGEGGFKRLMSDGAWFTNCHYPYSDTLTAPGHASLATGSTPSRHGIVANDWYDRKKGDMTTSVEDEHYLLLPRPSTKVPGASPWRRREETLGDVLLNTRKKGKVASLSIKDRAAILMAALRAQICYWFSVYQGGFATSTYYRDQPHNWVTGFNKAKPADRWVDASWNLLRPDLDYAKFSGPDDVAAEGTGYQQGNTFPHRFAKAKAKSDKEYYSAITNSPQGNELLLEFAKRCIEAEKLGQGEDTDLLCLSFSCNDLIGHCWGPDSQEVLDVTLRSDRLVKDLLDFLDSKVGRDNYVIGMSADHGVCPIPEVAAHDGKDAGRVAPETLRTAATEALQAAFTKDGPKLPWIEAGYGPWLYFNYATLNEAKIVAKQAEQVAAEALAKVPGVLTVFTRSQIQDASIKDNALLDSLRLSFHSENSGDVIVIPRPYHIVSYLFSSPKSLASRTTHGSPHPYDTHVPLVVMGAGIRPGIHGERVVPQALPAILAAALDLRSPGGAIAPVPPGVLTKR